MAKYQDSSFIPGILAGLYPVFSRYTRLHREVPEKLYAHWAQVAPVEFKGIPVDALFFVRALDGLFDFFRICQKSAASCALPSRAADSVWHAWSSLDPAGLDRFTRQHFGRRLPHLETAALTDDPALALARTWVIACRLERRLRAGTGLPSLFALDRKLKMPGGWAYSRTGNRVYHQQIDVTRRLASGYHAHPALALPGLVAAGLLPAAMVEELQARRRTGNDGGAGSSCGSFWTAGDGGSHHCGDSGGHGTGDSGGHGCGSSCGSSCGSGCGGGGD